MKFPGHNLVSTDDKNQSSCVFLTINVVSVIKLISFLKTFQSSSLLVIFRREWQFAEIRENLQALTRRIVRKIPGATWHKTQVLPIQEEYITQVSEQIEGKVTKKLSNEFSRRESCILGALSRLN